MVKCDICRREIKPNSRGWDSGNNAQPIIDGRCCDDCNERIIIPFRIKSHFCF